MKNRNLRKYLSVASTGVLIFSECTPIDIINANIEGFRAIGRYNDMKRNKQAKELSKTHTAQAVFNNLGQFTGVKWVRKTLLIYEKTNLR